MKFTAGGRKLKNLLILDSLPTDFDEIKLHRYFEEDFLLPEALKLRTLETENVIEITKKAFR